MLALLSYRFIGRPFVKRFAPTLSDRCLSVCLSVCPVLSLCNVGVLWPNGCMGENKTWHAGRPRRWPHCVRWGHRSPLLKGHSHPFLAHIRFGQMAGWIKMCLGMMLGLGPGDFVLDADPAPLLKKGAQPAPPAQFSAHDYCDQMAG